MSSFQQGEGAIGSSDMLLAAVDIEEFTKSRDTPIAALTSASRPLYPMTLEESALHIS
jgi:hypothetical protein